MRIQFLGTAAAEAWPAVFCNCETCNRARIAGGKDLRSRSSIMIDDNFKIDLPPDTYFHMIRDNLDLSALKALYITHSHFDHLSTKELEFLAPPYAHNLKNAPIKIHGSNAVIEKIKSAIPHMVENDHRPAELVELKPFVPSKSDHLTFTPIVASHNPNELCFNYVVDSGDASFLLTTDSGTYSQETLNYLSGIKLDALFAECTLGTLDFKPHGHMTFEAVLDLRKKLVDYGTMKSGAKTIITHFSHNIGLLHKELEAIANPEGIEVAYDGMVVNI